VNPLFHFKGSEEQRQKVIREQLEEINRIAINEYRQELLIQKRFLVIGNGNLINSFIISILFLSNAVALGLAIDLILCIPVF
jgi:hypothetical protein